MDMYMREQFIANRESNLRYLQTNNLNHVQSHHQEEVKGNDDKILSDTGTKKFCILRHDIDRIPENALIFARLESDLNIKGSYYFRIVPASFNFKIMNRVKELGHEIGYHYEDVDLTLKLERSKPKDQNLSEDKLVDLAYQSFCKNLKIFKDNFNSKTICMHGSPISKYDNRIIWKKYNYKNLGIVGEPYFDINWEEFGYLTDTGRRWNGNSVNIRDKVDFSPFSKKLRELKSTFDIISNIDKLPNKLMITVHPERWHNTYYKWIQQLAYQNLKNVAKYIIINSRKFKIF